jgi:hypothetical protein
MSDRRTRPAPIHLGVASIIATLAGCGASPAAPCGGCEPPLACLAFEVQVDGLIFAESSGARACSAACTADDACAALGPTAYCSTYDVCVVPCGVDTECAEGELCFGGACAAEIDDVRPDASPFGEARSPLALGARVGWQAWVDRCASDMVATSEPAGVLEVDAVTTSSGASEGCFVFAELRAIALGSADLVVSSGDVELRRDEVRVDLPARLSIVRVSIFGAGPPGRVDLQRVDGPGSLAVVARDVLGSRLAVGSGATWSIDDPRVGALSAPADGSIWLVGGLTSLSRAEGGTTTLRVRVGGVSRAVPVEL